MFFDTHSVICDRALGVGRYILTRQACINEGGYLATLRSSDELNRVVGAAGTFSIDGEGKLVLEEVSHSGVSATACGHQFVR